MACTEPFPLVPAIWITGGSERSGWPSAASTRHMRSSERSMIFGCSFSNRSRSTSLRSAALTQASPRGRRCHPYLRVRYLPAPWGGQVAMDDRRHTHQQAKNAAKLLAEILPLDDAIDHPVFEQ